MKISDLLLDGFEAKDSDGKSLKGTVLKHINHWYLYVLAVVVCVLLAYSYLKYTTEEYAISTTILIPSKSSDLTQNAVFSDLESYESTKLVENESEVLKSVSLMSSVLQDLDFRVSYFVKDNILRDKEVYEAYVPIKVALHEYDSVAFLNKDMPTYYSVHIVDDQGFELETEGISGTYSFGEVIESPFGAFSIEAVGPISEPTTIFANFNNPYSLAGRYVGKLDVFVVNKLASVLRVSLTDPVPEKGILVLNKLIATYNQEAIKDKNKTAENTISFIDEQLGVLTAEIRDIEQEIETYKSENRISQLGPNAQLFINRSVESENQFSEYTVQLQILESIEKYIENNEDYQTVPSSLTIQDPTLSNLITEFNALQMDRERMLRTTQPNNPLVQNLNQQLAAIKRNILENIRNIKSSLEITRNSLLSRTSRFDDQSERMPEIERQLLEIGRQQSIKQDHYTYLVQKREEAALSLAATTMANSRIIDPAMAGSNPVKPKKLLVLGFALVAGVGFPFAFVFVKYQLNNKILTKKSVVARTNIPVLGEVAHYRGKETFIISKNDRSPIAEQFRLIRTNLQFALPADEHKVVLVTSSVAGEGKTFFSLNLGISLGMAGKKVAICELDLRKPGLLSKLGIERGIGISDYLVNEDISIPSLKIKSKDLSANLTLFGCGEIPENPSELMLMPKLGSFIAQLKEEYDVVILDSAPIGQVADAFSLTTYSDISIYLIRYNYTSMDMLDFLNENSKEEKIKNPAIVLNDADSQSGYLYGYYGENKKSKKPKYAFS